MFIDEVETFPPHRSCHLHISERLNWADDANLSSLFRDKAITFAIL